MCKSPLKLWVRSPFMERCSGVYVFDTALFDKVCQWLATGQWFSPGTLISSTNQRLPVACNRSPGSKLLSITTQLHCGGHLGGRAWLPDTILEKDHPMTIPSKFGSNWATGSRQTRWFLCEFPIGSHVKLSSAVQPSWSEGRTAGHIFGRHFSEGVVVAVMAW